MGKYRRKHYAIDKLPEDVKNDVDEMIKADFTYSDIVEYIKNSGYSISRSSVQRYATNLLATLQELRMAQENFKAIMEEAEQYKNIDYTECIMRLLSSHILEILSNTPKENIQNVDFNALMKSAISLTRAAAYKKNVEYKTEDLKEMGVGQVKSMLYSVLASDHPELYKKLKQILNDKFNNEKKPLE